MLVRETMQQMAQGGTLRPRRAGQSKQRMQLPVDFVARHLNWRTDPTARCSRYEHHSLLLPILMKSSHSATKSRKPLHSDGWVSMNRIPRLPEYEKPGGQRADNRNCPPPHHCHAANSMRRKCVALQHGASCSEGSRGKRTMRSIALFPGMTRCARVNHPRY